MTCVSYNDPDIQNAFWEGFTHKCEVTNLFVWNFYGECIHVAVHHVGSTHDSRMAIASGLYYPLLSDHTPAGFSIFPRTGQALDGKVVRARKQNERGPNSDVPNNSFLAAVDTLRERAMPSESQSAEWGIKALKGPFQRLTVTLPADARKRLRILTFCVHFYNFRTLFVGLNRLRTVYTAGVMAAQPWVQELYLEANASFI